MNLLNFNSNNKSWKIYTNTITSINGDDLLIKPNNTNDLILEVSANNHIIFKNGDISYSINTKFDSLDTSFNNVYTTFETITTSFSDVNTKFDILDASFNNKLTLISGNIVPLNDICYNLGSQTKRWANAYIRDISVTNISASGNIIPLFNLSGSLGTSNNIWNIAYICDLSGLVNINGLSYQGGTIDLTNVTTNINPSNDASGSLGLITKYWSNAYIHDISVSSIDVSVNINPLINASGSLGSATKIWGNAYIRDLSVISIDVSVNINPLINNRGSLGSANKIWGNAYIRDLSVSSIDISVNINPLINNRGSLGISGDMWGNAYIRDLSVNSITISGNIVPLTNYTGSLGSSTRYWNSAYSNRLTIIHTANLANVPGSANINGVGLFIENSNTSPNQRSILFLRCTNNSSNSRVAIAIVIGYDYGWQISVRQESSTSNSTLFFNISETGNDADRITFNADGSATCVTLPTSDDRLKHNEIIINNGLTIIDQLTPKFYQKTQVMLDTHYNGDLSGYTWFYEAGLIAQELLQIKDISFVVQGGDYYDSNNIFTKQAYSVCYSIIFAYGLAAIKELHAKVKTQESIIVNLQSTMLNQQITINSLISRIQALKNKIS